MPSNQSSVRRIASSCGVVCAPNAFANFEWSTTQACSTWNRCSQTAHRVRRHPAALGIKPEDRSYRAGD